MPQKIAITLATLESKLHEVNAIKSGTRIEFDVTASDAAGEIGKGTHTRVIVDAKRFMAKANAKSNIAD